MPVIRLTPTAPAFRLEQCQALLDQLSRELAGQATENGPVVFEIPLDQTDKMDVLVVWEAWKDVPSEIRSDVILEAYKDKKDKISQRSASRTRRRPTGPAPLCGAADGASWGG